MIFPLHLFLSFFLSLFFSIALLSLLEGGSRMISGDQNFPSSTLGAAMLVISLQVCENTYQAAILSAYVLMRC